MTPLAKSALVIGGYLAALGVAIAVTAAWIALSDAPDAQASSGMYAFGDATLFAWVLGVASLFPTGAALHFLREFRGFWNWLAAGSAIIACAGVLAAILFIVGRDAGHGELLVMAADFSVIRILVAPLMALCFVVCAWFAPHRVHRAIFIGAAVAELAVSAVGAFIWVLPLHA